MSYTRGRRPSTEVHISVDDADPIFDGRRASQVVEEAGAAEGFYPDGTLKWRRILRRRTADLLPAPPRKTSPREDRASGRRLGIIGASVVAQLVFWSHLGAVLIGDSQYGAGRGGALGYLAGSALATLIVWMVSRR